MNVSKRQNLSLFLSFLSILVSFHFSWAQKRPSFEEFLGGMDGIKSVEYLCEPQDYVYKRYGDGQEIGFSSEQIPLSFSIFAPKSNGPIGAEVHRRRVHSAEINPYFKMYGHYQDLTVQDAQLPQGVFGHFSMQDMKKVEKSTLKIDSVGSPHTAIEEVKVMQYSYLKRLGFTRDEVMQVKENNVGLYMGGAFVREHEGVIKELSSKAFWYLAGEGVSNSGASRFLADFANLIIPQTHFVAVVDAVFSEQKEKPQEFAMDLRFVDQKGTQTDFITERPVYSARFLCVNTGDVSEDEVLDTQEELKKAQSTSERFNQNPVNFRAGPEFVEVLTLTGEIVFVHFNQIKKAFDTIDFSNLRISPQDVALGTLPIAALAVQKKIRIKPRASGARRFALRAGGLVAAVAALPLEVLGAYFAMSSASQASDQCSGFYSPEGWNRFLDLPYEDQLTELRYCNRLAGAILEIQSLQNQ